MAGGELLRATATAITIKQESTNTERDDTDKEKKILLAIFSWYDPINVTLNCTAKK